MPEVSVLPDWVTFCTRLGSELSDRESGDDRRDPAHRPAVVLVVGVDRLSDVRQTLGFTIAEEIAQRIADRLAHAAPRASLVARVGDDTFAVAWSTSRPSHDASACADRLIECIESPIRVGVSDLRLIAAVGASLYPEDGTRPEMLLANALAAMRFARAQGMRLFQFYRAAIGQQGAGRLVLEAELRRGLDQGEFFVHYQPRRTLSDKRVVGVEALMRWDHPERGVLPATDFVEAAVETGLITPIGEVVLRQACRDAAQWPDHVHLSVNLSTREFRGARLEGIVDRALADSGLAPNRFLVELTEYSLERGAGETDIALVRLTALRERGVRIVLDNFGAGAGSLDLLRRCRAEYVKISAGLIRGLGTEADRHAVVSGVATLARHFGAAVIAEGIESEEQLDAALRAGCSQGQGFYLGRPVSADQAGVMLGAVEAAKANLH
jgi:diguanylate cyclase (GGDEF)-like protein